MQAQDSIEELVSAKEWECWQKLEILSAADLLEYFPKRHEDRRIFDAFPTQAGERPVCIRGLVTDSARKGFGGRKSFYEVAIQSQGEHVFGGNQIVCRWFNMPYVSKVLAAGQEVILFGKVKDSGGRLVIDHPEFEVLEEGGTSSVHLERIVPVYKLISGLNQRKVRELVYKVVESVEPDSIKSEFDVDETYPRAEAFRDMHFPDATEAQQAACRYFALEEFFLVQLNVAWRKFHFKKQKGRVLGLKKTLLAKFHEQLPFDLTGAQKRSVKEIAADMAKPEPMNRMLQGDVGSGKTFVALCAALLAIESGVQAVLMAPTQILAEQHYLEFQKWLSPLSVNVGLFTANRKEGLEEAQIVIGTHALLFEHDTFEDLGLVIVDEQHKFGVEQRSKLIQKGYMPDVLVMTATPIPRTLTLTIYGDLDVSILDERPLGRGAVVTGVRIKPKVSDVTRFIKEQLNKGRQAYIVYPLVEESETLRAESATEAFEKWKKRFSKYGVGLLHGKLKPGEKDAVMTAFRAGETKVLVATTVIEVGVDVPNANIMVIYNAERFGLAQIHQLRGRIGRGAHKSYCILVTDGRSESAAEKLDVMAETQDGFKIAEADLRLRGPGNVLGIQQSGLSNLRFVDYLSDSELIREARKLADSLIQKDPHLDGYPKFAAKCEMRKVFD